MTTRDDIDSIRQHPVWPAIQKLRDSVKAGSPIGPTDRETFARVEAILAYAAGYRAFTPQLFPSTYQNDFNAIHRDLRYLSDLLSSKLADQPLPQNLISQIDSYLDNILRALSEFPSLQKESRARVISEAGDAFRLSTEASVLALEEHIRRLEEQITEGRESVNALVVKAGQAKTEVDEAHESLVDSLTEADARSQRELAQRLEAFDNSARDFRTSAEQDASNILEHLREQERTAQTLLEHVADASVAGGYQKYAKKEEVAYRVWNGLGLSIAAVVAIYLAVKFWDLETLTIQESILRAALSLPGLALAAYCLRQATVRQRQAVEAKYRELDLLAVNPFTDKMNDAQRSQLRMLLGERIFGQPVQSSAEDKASSNPLGGLSMDDVVKLVQTLRAP